MVQSSNVILLIHETTKTNIINHALFWVWLNEHGHDIQPSCKTVNFEMPWTSTEISTARACDHDGPLPVTRQSVRLHTGHLSVLWTLLNEILKNLGFKKWSKSCLVQSPFYFFLASVGHHSKSASLSASVGLSSASVGSKVLSSWMLMTSAFGEVSPSVHLRWSSG